MRAYVAKRLLLSFPVMLGVTMLVFAAVRLAPDSPEMHYSLVRAYTRGGRAEDAARERAIFTELDRKRRVQRGEPGAEGPGDKERPR